MKTGRQVIPATTTTALELSGHFQFYLKSITNNIDVVNPGDSDATDGYTLTADLDYVVATHDTLYLYAASETTVQYMVI